MPEANMRVTPARCERRRPICAATLAAFLTLVAGATGCRSARRSRSVPVPEVTANRDLVRATPVGGAELATLVDRAAAAPGDLGLLLQASRRLLATEGTWERLDELLGRTRGRFPESGTLAALAGLVADHAGRADEARAAFARGLLLEHGGDAMVQLAVRLDQRATEVLAAERRRRQEEEKRLAAEQRAAERKRRNEEFARLWLMQQYGVGRIGGSGGGADTGYQYTGPGIVDQWSNQQMLNGMWSHNMGR